MFLPIWFVFAVLSVFALAGSEISQKRSLIHKVDVSAITNNFYVWMMQGIGGLIIAILLGQLQFNLSPGKLILLAGVAITYFFGGTFFYTSYKGNSPSISIILGSLSVVVSTTLGIVFLNEPAGLKKFIGILFILISIAFLNYNRKERFSRNNLLALAGGACFGLAYTLDKSLVLVTTPALYVGIMSFSVAAVSLILRPKLIIAETKTLKLENFSLMFLASFFGTMFNFFTFSSYNTGGNVGVVDAINNVNVFLVIMLEIMILKDKSHLRKKLFCAGLAVIGLIILSGLK